MDAGTALMRPNLVDTLLRDPVVWTEAGLQLGPVHARLFPDRAMPRCRHLQIRGENMS
jgi:hypothetical protein